MREDWIEVELGEAFNITYGKGLSTKDLLKEGYPVYGANGVIGFYSDYKYEERQVLISCRGAASGKINISPEKCFITNNSLIVESSSDFISKEYLYFILSGANRSKIVTGSAQPQVTINNANPLIIKLAPLPTQRAIVSKIEALFSDLDNGIANFKKAQEQLKIYRQAVLKKAFEGELTKEWREKQTNLPTAEELLKQIKEERLNHYNQQIEDWKKAIKEWEKIGKVGKKPSKPAQPKELPPLKKEELEDLPILPFAWAWCRNLNVSTKITDGEHITPKREKSGYYLLSARNIQNGYISYTNVDYVGEDEYLRIRKRCNPEFGDILISCSGSVGRISLVPKNSNFVMVRSVALVKTNVKIYNPKFLEYLFLSPILQSQIEDGKKATAQANLFLEPIGKLNVILCSLVEQNQIVQEIESRLSVCDKVEQSINENIEKAEALRQSILKKAFEGKLLSQAEIEQCKQAADYEPASELLKKIKADKLAKEQEQKKATTKKKSKK
ncbi:MAG: restriction endonuclease subunit S [Clostridia bacterium]|jgi:type I restriction enzyme S subunit|nr:restriction endonuclease subunit S [Clostridia bacterium]MDD3093220.1 restriction endonuclease subunit S [Clostridia bacterium]MDD3971599.1 restriction endonuclease subunit S [Clostridia bacterium]